jgi:hypothetical protein
MARRKENGRDTMSNANTTILTDENGVLREYRQVKRKANVGERIKVIDDRKRGDHDFELGEILYVIHDNRWPNSNPNGGVSVSEHFQKARSKFEGRGIYNDRYVVLEPTDIVIIDGVRYREERRKARKGERILYVWEGEQSQVYTAIDVKENGDVRVDDEYDDGTLMIHYGAYRVLTPIDEPKAESSTMPAVYNVTINVTVNGTVDDVARTVADAMKRELTKMSAQEFVSHAEELLGLTKSPQQLRDEIVERAKRDVTELAKPHWNGSGDLVYAIHPFLYTAEFVVNRDKRTVVCLLRQYSRNNGYPVVRRGIAKCAPGDVFNSHIGRAIALRRALGLPVPDEYLNAPQPTEVRVGDVVVWKSDRERTEYRITGTDGNGTYDFETEDDVYKGYHYADLRGIVDIIDDSREATEVSA